MKLSKLVLSCVLCLLASSQDFLCCHDIHEPSRALTITENDFEIVLTCPRCRRAAPPGPRRRPLPRNVENPGYS